MSTSSKLLQAIKIGNIQLKHRVALCPLTRLRSTEQHVPSDLNVTYYSQRASDGGLLIAEGTLISPMAGNYPYAPGIWTQDQIDGWKRVTSAVHAKGGFIFSQLWHVGRVTNAALLPDNQPPVAPSPIAVNGAISTGMPPEVPRELKTEEIPAIIQEYVVAAKNAIEAGFNGVELHGATGYLIDQFIQSGSNKRIDQYGGSLKERARFALEVVDAVANAVGEERTAIRFSPWSSYNDMKDDTPIETFSYICEQLHQKHPKLAYVHLVEDRALEDDYGSIPPPATSSLKPFRDAWKGLVITAGNYSNQRDHAFKVAEETDDIISFGRAFIANPDLPERLKNGWPLNKYDRSTFFGGNAKGYTDYPFYDNESST